MRIHADAHVLLTLLAGLEAVPNGHTTHRAQYCGEGSREVGATPPSVAISIRFARECEMRITGFRTSFLPEVPAGGARRTCPPEVPAGRARRRCPPDVPAGRARRRCPPEVPAGRARRTFLPDVPAGGARRRCPPEVPAGRARRTCPPDVPAGSQSGGGERRSAASTRPAWIVIHAVHSQGIGQSLAPQNSYANKKSL